MRHSRRLLNPLLLPALIGAVLAAFAWVLAPDSRVYVLVSPAVLLATVGLLTSGCILITMRVRMRYQRRIQAGIVDTQIAADQARRRFVARLDHELKNPLTALLTVLSDPATDSAGRVQASVLGTARGQADRMRRLLTDLRRVADVETAALDIGPVDLAALLSDTVELVKADTRGARPIRLVVPAAPRPLPLVPGDADLLLVAIYNVLSNAMKYSRPGDAIEVRAREMPGPAGHIVIDIADSGPGIAPADIDVVWEELARGSSSAGVPGSGIGLALVRVILARHGGSPLLDSRANGGASVTLRLPVHNSGGIGRPG